jgi:hypothetical protein
MGLQPFNNAAAALVSSWSTSPDEVFAWCSRTEAPVPAELALRRHPFVALRVHPDNAVARRCYAAAGFERATPSEEDEWNRGQPVAFVWMVWRDR